jgi:23S rRNA-/tRNA-specific pseudouridylate synthase
VFYCSRCGIDAKQFDNFGSLAWHAGRCHADVPLQQIACACNDPLGKIVAGLQPRTVYNDEDMCICIKPAGFTTPAFHTLEGLFLLQSSKVNRLPKPKPVHRLDEATAGCLVLGKSDAAVAALSLSFAERAVSKTYLAIACGDVRPDEGVVETPVGGKACHTVWRVLRRDPSATHGCVTTLSLQPHTGRKHQLRRHLAHTLKCPIVGDPRYCPRITQATARPGQPPPPLMLWAAAVELPHPLVAGARVAAAAPEPAAWEVFRATQAAEAAEAAAAQVTTAEAGSTISLEQGQLHTAG